MNLIRVVLIASLLGCGSIPATFAQDEVDLITGFLGEKDKEMRALAFDQIRKEVKGEAATKKFAELLPKFPAETQIGLLSALADRGDAAAAPAVRKLLAESKDEVVRVAAVKALGPLGTTDDLKLLLDATTGSDSLREAARESLIRLPNEVSAGMLAELKSANAATQVILLPILTARRVRDAVPLMLEIAGSDDAKARTAALTAVAELGDDDNIPQLVPLVLKAAAGKERDAVEKTIASICQRNPDKSARATVVLTVLEKSKEAEQAILLSTLGRIGGPAALKQVDAAWQSSRADLQAAGLRALCNWPDGTVVSRLLHIARTDKDADQRKQAFQALVRIAPLADERSDQLRLDTVRTVFAMCTSDAERNQVLERAKAIRNIATLRFLLPFLEQPPFAQQACLTVVELAHHSSLRESHKDEFMPVLDQVQQLSKDSVVIDRARRYQTGQTWVRPKNAE